MVLTTIICGQFVVSWEKEENELERNAIFLSLEGMTLPGVSEQTEPQLFLPDVRSYSYTQVALWSSSFGVE